MRAWRAVRTQHGIVAGRDVDRAQVGLLELGGAGGLEVEKIS